MQNSITVFDSKGTTIYTKSYSDNLMKVNLKSVAAGSYFVVLRDGYGNKIAAAGIFVQP